MEYNAALDPRLSNVRSNLVKGKKAGRDGLEFGRDYTVAGDRRPLIHIAFVGMYVVDLQL